MPTLNRRFVLVRLAFCLLFAFLAGLQFRVSLSTLDLISDPEKIVGLPVIDLLTLAYANPGKATAAAGIQKGDILVAVNGVQVHSVADQARLFFAHKPGDALHLTVKRGPNPPFDVNYVIPALPHANGWGARLIVISLNIIIPWSCLLLGFLVAYRRPLEPVTGSLVFLLILVSQAFRLDSTHSFYAWEFDFSWAASFFNTFSGAGLAASWLWVSIQFPDPKSPNRFWPWARFVLGLPLILLYALDGVWSATAVHNPKALAALAPLQDLPDKLLDYWAATLIVLGCVNLALKLKREKNLSLRRRLKWAFPGLVGGILPVCGATLFTGGNVDSLPPVVELICLVSPLLIPLTLAYALLVDRLFDLGVVVRQGLLASKTVTLVRVALVPLMIYGIVFFTSQKHLSNSTRVAEIAAGVIVIALTGRAFARLRAAVDRRFFQQAVNSEQLLLGLSNEVRGIRDAHTLLRTVTERVGSAMYLSRVAALLPEGAGFVPAYAYGGDLPPLPFDDPAVSAMNLSFQPTPRADDLLVPISTGATNGLQGVLWLGPKRSEEPYSGRDLSLLESVAGQTALALENTKLTAAVAQEAANRERINSELELARTVQERLFPKKAPQVPGLDLAGLCRPAQTVGGDYFDFFTTSSGLTGFAIGDIAGKGVSAALLMASLQASLRAMALSGFSNLSDLMAKLNVLMYDASPANRFATFFCCLYDPPSKRLLYSSAGHNPALLIQANTGQSIWLNTRSNALGLTPKSTYEQAELLLRPGDRLILYTDGVTEARNPAGDEFGEQRLLEAIRATPVCSASALAHSLLTATTNFASTATQHDDITVITAVSLETALSNV